MEFRIKQEFLNHFRNLADRMRCFRFATFIIMIFFFMDLYLSTFREDVMLLGQKCNIVVLPFLQTSDYYIKIIFLAVVYFYANVPFMEKKELFYIIRLGKERWGKRNLFYIMGSSFVIVVCFFIISSVEILTSAKFSFSWDSVYKTLSLTGGQNLGFEIPYAIIKEYEPFILGIIVFFLDWLVVMMIGMIMYVISLYGQRILSSIIAIVIVFLPSINAWLGGILIYYSPVSWLDCSNWRIGYDNRKPDLPYMLVAGIFFNVLLIIISQHRVKKMEWKTQDD